MEDNIVKRQTIGMGAMSQQEKENLHAACLEVLQRTGIEFNDQESLEILKKHGAEVEGKVAKIPAKMVEEAIKSSPETITIYDRTGAPKLFLEKGRFYFGTGSDTPYVQDYETDKVRRAVIQDTVNAAIVSDALPNINFIMSMGLASNEPVLVSDIYQHVAMLKNSIKPQILTAHDEVNMKTMLEINEMATGSPIGDKPNLMLYNEPSSPLRHAREVCQKALLCADTGLPVIYAPGVMVGGASPVTLAGGMVIANTELLSGLVLHQCRRPGAPFIYGGAAVPLDLRTGICCYVAPEGQLNMVYLSEMARYYNLPVFTMGGASDALTFDQQTAAEAMYTLLVNAMSGANLIHDVGFMGQGMVASIDSIVACNELIGLVKRLIRGVDMSPEKLAVDEICKVGIGGSFLESEVTYKYFREEYWIPELINRDNVINRMEHGGGFADNVKKKIRKLLSEHQPAALSPNVLQAIDQRVTRAQAEKKDIYY